MDTYNWNTMHDTSLRAMKHFNENESVIVFTDFKSGTSRIMIEGKEERVENISKITIDEYVSLLLTAFKEIENHSK